MRMTTLVAIACAVSSACHSSTEPPASSTSRADAVPSTEGAAVSDKREYQCGEIKVSANFHGVGPVQLRFDGNELTLPLVASGSGARYADGSGNEFWSKGDQAMFTIAGQQMRICTSAAAPPA